MSFRPKGAGPFINFAADCLLGMQVLGRKPPRGDLAICAIFRDEAEWLREWIEYHRLMGVEYFFLYNNRSRDDFRRILRPYCTEGVAELIDLNLPDPFNRWQIKAINHALERAKGRFRWLASIDVDEFLIPGSAGTLPQFLRAFERHPAVILNWRMFGTSGCHAVPRGRTSLEVLTRCAPRGLAANRQGKPIVQPDQVIRLRVHEPVLAPGLSAVNALGEPFDPNEIPNAPAWINHYWWRTESWFWRYKVPRREAYERLTGGRIPSEAEWRKDMDEANSEEDLAIQCFVPELRRRLGLEDAV